MYILSFSKIIDTNYVLRLKLEEEQLIQCPLTESLYSPFSGDFPLRFCCVPRHAKSHDNAGIWNLPIYDEIFHVLGFLRRETCSVLYYTYGYNRNPKSIYC